MGIRAINLHHHHNHLKEEKKSIRYFSQKVYFPHCHYSSFVLCWEAKAIFPHLINLWINSYKLKITQLTTTRTLTESSLVENDLNYKSTVLRLNSYSRHLSSVCEKTPFPFLNVGFKKKKKTPTTTVTQN